MAVERVKVSQTTFDAWKKELESHISLRSEISKRIGVAREQGDLSENAEYDAAREEQSLNEIEIMKLQDMIDNAEIDKNASNEAINRGDVVNVIDIELDEKIEFEIVDTYSVDSVNRKGNGIKLSNENPLVRALQHSSIGDVVAVTIGENTFNYKFVGHKKAERA